MNTEGRLRSRITAEKVQQAIRVVNSENDLTVEGCEYKVVREESYDDMLDFLRDHFWPHEPISHSLNVFMGDELRMSEREVLQQNLSIAVVVTQSGQIVGSRMIKVTSKEEKLDHAYYKSERLRRVFDVMGELDRRCSIFDHYGVDEVIHFYGFGVHSDFRRRGIGEKLMKAALLFVRNLKLGSVVIKGEGTSNYSKRVFEKLGFETLAEAVYDDFTVDGNVVLGDLGDHISEKLFGLKLH